MLSLKAVNKNLPRNKSGGVEKRVVATFLNIQFV
jgi:hypothetical protein